MKKIFLFVLLMLILCFNLVSANILETPIVENNKGKITLSTEYDQLTSDFIESEKISSAYIEKCVPFGTKSYYCKMFIKNKVYNHKIDTRYYNSTVSASYIFSEEIKKKISQIARKSILQQTVQPTVIISQNSKYTANIDFTRLQSTNNLQKQQASQ